MQITDIGELQRLSACPCLRALALRPNPGVDAIDEPTYRAAVARACPDLELLDGKPITAAERAGAERAPDLSALAAHQVGRPLRLGGTVACATLRGCAMPDMTASHASGVQRARISRLARHRECRGRHPGAHGGGPPPRQAAEVGRGACASVVAGDAEGKGLQSDRFKLCTRSPSFDRSLLERNLATTGGNVSRKGLYTGVKSRIGENAT